MHSHDRTLLSSLGFADKDKTNPRHDLAIAYMQTWEASQAWIPAVAQVPGAEWRCGSFIPEELITKGQGQYATTVGFLDMGVQLTMGMTVGTREIIPCQTRPIPKVATTSELSSRGWRTYSDEEDAEWDELKRAWTHAWETAPSINELVEVRWNFIVEVKIAREPIGNVVRQLTLYGSHWRGQDRHPWGSRSLGFAYECSVHHSGCPSLGLTGYGLSKATWPELPKSVLVTDYPISPADKSALDAIGCCHLRLGQKFEKFVEAQRGAEVDSVSI